MSDEFKDEWRITPQDDGTLLLYGPGIEEPVMRCYPEQENAVAFYVDLINPPFQLSGLMARAVTLIEAAKRWEKVKDGDE